MNKEFEPSPLQPHIALILLPNGEKTLIPFTVTQINEGKIENLMNEIDSQKQQEIEYIVSINLPGGAKVIDYLIESPI